MQWQKLPLHEDWDYRYTVNLEGVLYNIRLYYSNRTSDWTMNIFTETGESVTGGVRIRSREPIRITTHKALTGIFWLEPKSVSVDNENLHPSLINKYFNFYYGWGEVEEREMIQNIIYNVLPPECPPCDCSEEDARIEELEKELEDKDLQLQWAESINKVLMGGSIMSFKSPNITMSSSYSIIPEEEPLHCLRENGGSTVINRFERSPAVDTCGLTPTTYAGPVSTWYPDNSEDPSKWPIIKEYRHVGGNILHSNGTVRVNNQIPSLGTLVYRFWIINKINSDISASIRIANRNISNYYEGVRCMPDGLTSNGTTSSGIGISVINRKALTGYPGLYIHFGVFKVMGNLTPPYAGINAGESFIRTKSTLSGSLDIVYSDESIRVVI